MAWRLSLSFIVAMQIPHANSCMPTTSIQHETTGAWRVMIVTEGTCPAPIAICCSVSTGQRITVSNLFDLNHGLYSTQHFEGSPTEDGHALPSSIQSLDQQLKFWLASLTSCSNASTMGGTTPPAFSASPSTASANSSNACCSRLAGDTAAAAAAAAISSARFRIVRCRPSTPRHRLWIWKCGRRMMSTQWAHNVMERIMERAGPQARTGTTVTAAAPTTSRTPIISSAKEIYNTTWLRGAGSSGGVIGAVRIRACTLVSHTAALATCKSSPAVSFMARLATVVTLQGVHQRTIRGATILAVSAVALRTAQNDHSTDAHSL